MHRRTTTLNALEGAKYVIEAALLDPEPAFQGLNHLLMGMRIFQVHIERGVIGCAAPFKSSLAAPDYRRHQGIHDDIILRQAARICKGMDRYPLAPA